MRIYNQTIKPSVINAIISKIKSKKELANLDERLCREKLEFYIKQNRKMRERLANAESFPKIAKSRDVEFLVKNIRRDLREVYGVFQSTDKANISEANKLLDELKLALRKNNIWSNASLKIHNNLLKLHLSSKERLDFYPQFFESIFRITGKPKSILDIAAGFNPMAFPYMGLSGIKYAACELNEGDVEIINNYFAIIGINGKAFKADLAKNPEFVRRFAYDIMFAFKIFDILDNKIVEKIIKACRCRHIVASFPIKTISTKMMRFPRRAGFQKMLRRLGLKYKTLLFGNEIVYVVEVKYN